jgi:general nucleoside transport system permease protein
MSVAKNYVLVMAVCGLFAGLAGALDVLGWQFRIATNDIEINQLGFIGIAVALLGRNTPIGIALGALLFAFLDRAALPLQFADIPSSVVTIIQGTIVLAVVVANEIARRLALHSAERAGASAGPGPDAGGGGGAPPPTAPDGGQRVRAGAPGTPEDVQA